MTSPSAGKGDGGAKGKGKGQSKGGYSQAAAYVPPPKQWANTQTQWSNTQRQWSPPQQRWSAPQQQWSGPSQQWQGSQRSWSNTPGSWNDSPRRWSGSPAWSAPPAQSKGGKGLGRSQAGGPPPKGDWWRDGNNWNPRCLVCRDKGSACMHDFASCPAYKAAFEAWEQKKNGATSLGFGGRGKWTDPGKGGK